MKNSNTNYGIVYLLTNPAIPGMVKIGMTNRDSEIVRQIGEDLHIRVKGSSDVFDEAWWEKYPGY
jgi:hypothetical protein